MSDNLRLRIGLFLDKINEGVNYDDPEGANPGIGGTQYLIWSLAYQLSKHMNVILFTPKLLPNMGNVCQIIASNLPECINNREFNNLDYFIVRGPFVKKEAWDLFDKKHVKIIVWSHNFENYLSIKNFSKHKSFFRNICVSKSQQMLLQDTNEFNKSIYIYNGISFKDYDFYVKKKENVINICYMGNLYPGSGFEDFLKSWNIISKKYPQLELVIIGGNNLYSGMKNLYSRRSIKRLKKLESCVIYNKDGSLKKNVTLTGVIGGKSKLEVMKSSDIAVTNITRSGETFGLSAIEFEALGIPVVSIDKLGIHETVLNRETGLLVKNRRDLSNAIETLIVNSDLRRKLSVQAHEFARNSFDINNILIEWIKFFKDPDSYQIMDSTNKISKNKFIELNLKFRKYFKTPPILFYKYLIYVSRRLLEKANII